MARAGRIARTSSSPAAAATAACSSFGASEKTSVNSIHPPFDGLWCGKTGARTSSLQSLRLMASPSLPEKREARCADRVAGPSPSMEEPSTESSSRPCCAGGGLRASRLCIPAMPATPGMPALPPVGFHRR